MVFTIEPMLNQGTRHVHLNYNDDWTVYTDDGKLSAQWEHTFLVTEDGVEIISK
jgi:methionyl aminopeptidase